MFMAILIYYDKSSITVDAIMYVSASVNSITLDMFVLMGTTMMVSLESLYSAIIRL